jgi:hypothetical protein
LVFVEIYHNNLLNLHVCVIHVRIDDRTFHYKFLGSEFPEIVPDQAGGSLGPHELII